MNVTDYLLHSMDWIRGSGWLGVGWFIALYSISCVLFLPGSILSLGAGAVYGFWLGTLLVTFSSSAGAAVCFLISRYVARDWVQKKLGQNTSYVALENAVGKKGWRTILLSRVSPIVPHTIVSYAAGLTRISFWRFFFASFLGFMPMNAAYAYTGAVLGAAVRHTHSLKPHDAFTWTVYILGLIVTFVVVIWAGRAATRAWKEQVPGDRSA